MIINYPKNIQELSERLEKIEQALQYGFCKKPLLVQALTHRSYLNEAKGSSLDELASNERLEFLGDAVLDNLVSHYLFEKFPQMSEGELSQLRSQIVDASTCEKLLCQLQVQDCLLLGRGQRMSTSHSSILADLFEAILGAIYLDGGWNAAHRFYWGHFQHRIIEICENPACNWKALLQDLAQKRLQQTPHYKVLLEEGPEHTKAFEVGVFIGTNLLAKGLGNSKKLAQQDAAKTGFQLLNSHPDILENFSNGLKND